MIISNWSQVTDLGNYSVWNKICVCQVTILIRKNKYKQKLNSIDKKNKLVYAMISQT